MAVIDAEATEPQPQPPPRPPPRRWPLGLRIVLLCAFLVALAVGSATALTWVAGQRLAAESMREALDHGAAAQRSATGQRLSLLERTIQLVAADPALVNYVATALGDDLGLGAGDGRDTGSLRDLLVERREQFGFDLGLVLDVDAVLVARSDDADVFEESFADDPLVAAALEQLGPQSGFWRMDDALYQAAVMPLGQDGLLVGFVLLAQRIDDALCQDIAAGSGAEIAFWLPGANGPELAAGSLPPERTEALADALAASARARDALALGRSQAAFELDLGDDRWLLRLSPTAGEGVPELGMVSSLASSTAAASGYRAILNHLLLAGAGAIVVALLLSLAFSRRALAPVGRLAQAAEKAAEGDYHDSVAIGGNDELGRLASAFDSLLSTLREKEDIEGYVATFSRFVPEASDAEEAVSTTAPQPAPPTQGEGPLLAIELAPASAASFEAASAALDALGERVRARGGRLLGSSGSRALFAFDGERTLPRALLACRALLDHDPAPAACLVSGSYSCGEAIEGGRIEARVFGQAALQAERLLSESAPGAVLVARPVGDQLREDPGTGVLEIGQGTLSGKRYYRLRGEGLAGLPEPEVDTRRDPDVTAVSPAVNGGGGAAQLAPGRVLSGRYELLAKLGEGGMGVVYKARDRELDDIVALKMLKPGALVDREQLERLKDEIRLARRITHPNVLRTYDFGEADGLPFISMEFVRGLTLRALLEQSGRLPYSAGLRIARQLAAGLGAAHEVGVLHRDIKPENLILESGGNARLMDFGIARPARRAAGGHTAPGMFVGTPHYSPPEQLAGEEVDERADIHAVGVLLSEMFCGGLPYPGNNTMEIYMAQVQREPVRPSELWPEIPPALELLILRCIARRREDRFQSADELAAALSGLRA